MRVILLVGLGLSVACGPESQNSLFGAGTPGQTATASASASASGSTGSDATSTSGAEGSAEGMSANTTDPTAAGSSEGTSGETTSPSTGVEPGTTSTTSAAGSTGDTSASTGAAEESSTSSTGAGEEEEDDGGMDAGVQPGDGMYAPCTEAEDCGFDPELCIILSDGDGAVLDGFCSETTCSNPAADCDGSPGTAPTACLDVDVDGAADSACVLECTAGDPCPAGMTCYALPGISICG